jgi:hypothetical protein
MDAGKVIYRSSSFRDVCDSPEKGARPPPLEVSSTSKINAQPQDYVVVSGKPVRVIRSPRPPLFGVPGDEVTAENLNYAEFRNSIISKSYEDLAQELFEAKKCILRQDAEIKRLKNKLSPGESMPHHAEPMPKGNIFEAYIYIYYIAYSFNMR